MLCGWPAFSRQGFRGAAYGWYCRYRRSLFGGLVLVMRRGGGVARFEDCWKRRQWLGVEIGRERLNDATCGLGYTR